jgi:branched-chain amino acid transport system permease protein
MPKLLKALPLIFALAFPFLPLGDRTAFIQQISLFVLSSAILALSWDFLARTGQLSLAHAAFFGLGAYTFALLANAGVPQVLAFLAAGIFSSLASLLLGAVTLRLHGMYFAIATLAFAEVLKTIINQLPFTGSSQGLLVPALFGGGFLTLYFVGLGVLLLLVVISEWSKRAKLGYAFTAIRQGELVARVLGVDATRVKLTAFVISSFFVGLVGAYAAGKTFYITPPEAFSTAVSVTALVMPIFGGLYSTGGPIIAAVVLRLLEEGLRLLTPQGYLIGYGVVLVLSILFLPKGLVSLSMPKGLVSLWQRRS